MDSGFQRFRPELLALAAGFRVDAVAGGERLKSCAAFRLAGHDVACAAPAPIGTFRNPRRAGRLVRVSGQGPVTEDGQQRRLGRGAAGDRGDLRRRQRTPHRRITLADKWLSAAGRLAFVITGSIFKNPSTAGFRTFQIEPKNPHSCHLIPRLVDDMKALKPLEDAMNHTTVVVFDKSTVAATYPIPYNEWAAATGNPRAIPVETPLAAIGARVQVNTKEAAPAVTSRLVV